ncbi:MAG TPA: prepilin-type N-terminal cleavage/methylation domain-containing protein, partial [Halioglobus sp.]
PRRRFRPGFTLVELLVAITIVGMVLAAAVPASVRSYESMRYRQAIRDVTTTLASARYLAVNTGRAQDVALNPKTNVIRMNKETWQLPANVNVVVHSAREVNRESEGIIRFYPEGGSSGGDIEIAQPNGSGVKISVDWLVGRVTQEKYVFSAR